jgi:hypothetical protein
MAVIVLYSNQRHISAIHVAIFRVMKTRIKVKVKFTLEQAMKAQRGSKGIALLFY